MTQQPQVAPEQRFTPTLEEDLASREKVDLLRLPPAVREQVMRTQQALTEGSIGAGGKAAEDKDIGLEVEKFRYIEKGGIPEGPMRGDFVLTVQQEKSSLDGMGGRIVIQPPYRAHFTPEYETPSVERATAWYREIIRSRGIMGDNLDRQAREEAEAFIRRVKKAILNCTEFRFGRILRMTAVAEQQLAQQEGELRHILMQRPDLRDRLGVRLASIVDSEQQEPTPKPKEAAPNAPAFSRDACAQIAVEDMDIPLPTGLRTVPPPPESGP